MQTGPLRLFKQVMWGDNWQLPLEGNTTGWSGKTGRIDMTERTDRTKRTDRTDRTNRKNMIDI